MQRVSGVNGGNVFTQSNLHFEAKYWSTSRGRRSKIESKVKTPKFLQLAVSGLTEILRVFSSSSSTSRYEDGGDMKTSSVWSVDDVIIVLKADYHNAYFVTGTYYTILYYTS
ncbi:hypothetical protein M5689_022760 [Euphorbia peplus]|nr:hypothetical protein M5689_022760 [Euphorbia peplus]